MVTTPSLETALERAYKAIAKAEATLAIPRPDKSSAADYEAAYARAVEQSTEGCGSSYVTGADVQKMRRQYAPAPKPLERKVGLGDLPMDRFAAIMRDFVEDKLCDVKARLASVEAAQSGGGK
jgi:hypothetical protein